MDVTMAPPPPGPPSDQKGLFTTGRVTLELKGFPTRPAKGSRKFDHSYSVVDPNEARRNPDNWVVGENAQELSKVGTIAAEHRRKTTHKDFGEPGDAETWSTPHLTGKKGRNISS